jgi:hypothetical protein
MLSAHAHNLPQCVGKGRQLQELHAQLAIASSDARQDAHAAHGVCALQSSSCTEIFISSFIICVVCTEHSAITEYYNYSSTSRCRGIKSQNLMVR